MIWNALRCRARLGISTGRPRRANESDGSPRMIKPPTPLGSVYFLGVQRYEFGMPYLTPYVNRPDARGSPRKLAKSNGRPSPDKKRIFSSKSDLQLWVSVADPVTWTDWRPAGADGI